MHRPWFMAIYVCLHLAWAGAAETVPIGSVNSSGDVRLNAVFAPSGSSLFAGQTVTTGPAAGASIALRDSTRVLLGRDARATFGAGKVLLEKGSARFTAAADRTGVYAAGLRLEPAEGTGAVEAALGENGRVTVSGVSGGFRVIDADGSQLASIRPGQQVLFGLAAQEQAQGTAQGRSGGQAPETSTQKKRSGGAVPAGAGAKGSKTALYVVIGAGAAAAGLGIALSRKRGS
jgi:hypothetical protein